MTIDIWSLTVWDSDTGQIYTLGADFDVSHIADILNDMIHIIGLEIAIKNGLLIKSVLNDGKPVANKDWLNWRKR